MKVTQSQMTPLSGRINGNIQIPGLKK